MRYLMFHGEKDHPARPNAPHPRKLAWMAAFVFGCGGLETNNDLALIVPPGVRTPHRHRSVGAGIADITVATRDPTAILDDEGAGTGMSDKRTFGATDQLVADTMRALPPSTLVCAETMPALSVSARTETAESSIGLGEPSPLRVPPVMSPPAPGAESVARIIDQSL